jgi:hypothetical protein
MLRALDLVGVGPAPRLTVELGERLNVFAGDNGLGKSFLLEVVWWVLTGTWAGHPAWPRSESRGQPEINVELSASTLNSMLDPQVPPSDVDLRDDRARLGSRFDFRHQEWSPIGPIHFAHKPLPCIVLYAGADGSFAVWDPARNHYELRPQGRWGGLDTDIWENAGSVRRPLSYRFTPRTLWNGLEMHGKTICSGLVRDWVSWQRQHDPRSTDEDAYSLLCRIIEALSPHPDHEEELIRPGSPVRVFVDDTREFPTINVGYGDVPVIHASAGMQRILGLAYLLVWSWREHVEASKLLRQEPVKQIVFLMDEVETHLHPAWQRRLVPSILKVLEALRPLMQGQLFLTTHAPLVLASLEPIFRQETDRFFVFELNKGAVRLNESPWFKRGDAVDWLTSDAFGLQQARSVDAEVAIEDAERFMRGEEHTKSREEIDRELRRALGGDDPFWPRWITSVGGPQP